MKKKLGFTLAEVLITLGIIGVVAAMTIPTLMNNSSQAEFRTGLKKSISILNQAIATNVAMDSSDFSQLKSGTDEGSIYAMFSSRLHVARTVSPTETPAAFGINNLWEQPAFADIAEPDKNDPDQHYATQLKLYLSDGMLIVLDPLWANCTKTKKCRMIVDVNGKKGPNMMSRAVDKTQNISDQFILEFYDQVVEPTDGAAKYAMYGSPKGAELPNNPLPPPPPPMD